MNSDNIINHILPRTRVIDWIVNRLQSISDFNNNVRIFEGQNLQYLFHFLPEVQPPVAVVTYSGSTYNSDNFRCVSNFKIYITVRNFHDKWQSKHEGVDLIDRVISILDHELIDNHALCIVENDKFVSLSSDDSDGCSCYELNIKVEDY